MRPKAADRSGSGPRAWWWVALLPSSAFLTAGNCGGNVNDEAVSVPFTVAVSVATAGTSGNKDSTGSTSVDRGASISRDGRYIAFASQATNLVTGDTNGKIDIFVRDTAAGTTIRVSVHSDGTEGDGDSANPDISPDGRYVVFESSAKNLVSPAFTSFVKRVYLRDLGATPPTTILVAKDKNGVATGVAAEKPRISESGKYVVFETAEGNMVSDYSGSGVQVYRRDFTGPTPTNVLVSASKDAATIGAGGSNTSAAITPDGRFVVFESTATSTASPPADIDADANPNGVTKDVFRRDMTINPTSAGASIQLVSVSKAGDVDGASGASTVPSVSSDGRYVAFQSVANDLHADDISADSDVFVRDITLGVTQLVSRASGATGTKGSGGNSPSPAVSISGDGRYVAFDSTSSVLVLNDLNLKSDVFVRDLTTNVTTRVSVNTVGKEGNDASLACMMSGDGRFVVFGSAASNLVERDLNGRTDVFLRGPGGF